ILGALAIAADGVFEAPLTLGPGFGVVDWLLEQHTVWVIGLLFVFRAVATLTTVGAGGVGGLFIPLAVQGVLLGSVVGGALAELGWASDDTIWPILGLAAFLAAGYRTPIAAVMFVAESSGGSAVVPALIAAAVSQLVAGSASVSSAQQVERLGHLEERFALPLVSALTTDVMTAPSDATISEFVWVHALGRRQRVVPVVDGADYRGLCSIDDVSDIDRDGWEDHVISEIMFDDAPTARPSWTLRDAVAAMDNAGTDLIAVTDDAGTFIGVVYESEIVKLGEILDETEGR
ncbi:MAG: chloride channel protein, partial [Acidimicrobiales bacterium]